MEEIKFSSYPAGWEKAKSLLKDVPEEDRENYLFWYTFTLYCN